MADYVIKPSKAELLREVNKLGVEGEADAIQMYYDLLALAEDYLQSLQTTMVFESVRDLEENNGSSAKAKQKTKEELEEISQVQDLINTIAQDIIPDEKDHLEKLRGHDDIISKIKRGS